MERVSFSILMSKSQVEGMLERDFGQVPGNFVLPTDALLRVYLNVEVLPILKQLIQDRLAE